MSKYSISAKHIPTIPLVMIVFAIISATMIMIENYLPALSVWFHVINFTLTITGIVLLLTLIIRRTPNWRPLFPWLLWLISIGMFYGFLLLRDYSVINMTSVLWWDTSIFINVWSNTVHLQSLLTVNALAVVGLMMEPKEKMIEVGSIENDCNKLIHELKKLNGSAHTGGEHN